MNMLGKYLTRGVLVFCVCFLISLKTASAEISEHGGEDQKFKGNGDLIPPLCQIDLPRSATSPFSIKWYCSDNDEQTDLIRTELWMYRKNEAAGRLIGNFLGFPAAAYVDQNVLEVTKFTDGLPVHFRLLARDRAGIAMATPFLTVYSRDNSSLEKCSLSITTEETKSTGNTIGLPSFSVELNDAKIISTQNTNDEFQITTAEKTSADLCEIESICNDGEEITFTANNSLKSNNAVSTTLSVSPGNLNVSLTGTFSESSAELDGLTLKGTTTIDGANAEVTLDCSK